MGLITISTLNSVHNFEFHCRHELENHMKITHNTTGKHKCLICDEIFPSPAVLAEHKLTHSKVGPSGTCSRCLSKVFDHYFRNEIENETLSSCFTGCGYIQSAYERTWSHRHSRSMYMLPPNFEFRIRNRVAC